MAAHQAKFIKRAWDIPKNTEYFLWVDAKVALEWLGQYNIKETFVHNRVKQIRELLEREKVHLKYIPSKQNPADMITKEQGIEKFIENESWFKGPKFLTEDQWPEQETEYTLFSKEKEVLMFSYKAVVKVTKEESFLKNFNAQAFRRNIESSLKVLAIVI